LFCTLGWRKGYEGENQKTSEGQGERGQYKDKPLLLSRTVNRESRKPVGRGERAGLEKGVKGLKGRGGLLSEVGWGDKENVPGEVARQTAMPDKGKGRRERVLGEGNQGAQKEHQKPLPR